ncbi:MAG: hypothetical protein N3B15_04645 [Planctomycetota bacterium]|nr:hypothetical protein [Planctomycetota bacterium]
MESGDSECAPVVARWLADPENPQLLAALTAASPLSASQLSRLPVRALPLLAGVPLRFCDPPPAVRSALLLLGASHCLSPPPLVEELLWRERCPVVMRIVGQRVAIALPARPEQWATLALPVYHRWAAGILAEALDIDASAVVQVNSVLINWLLQLLQAARPACLYLHGASPAIKVQLRQLRIDQLLSVL